MGHADRLNRAPLCIQRNVSQTTFYSPGASH